ncbi:MAG: cardiolipin synthase [Proteobacteria bacterium]|nr:cardiolipin synthase [Pseudomonadota bacterium]
MFDSWWHWLSLAETLWVIGLSVWILFERRSPGSTLAWILALSLLPIIGIAVYFVFGPRRFDRKKLRHSEAQEAAKRAGAQPDDAEAQAPKARHLIAQSEAAAGLPARARTADVDIYFSGRETYAALEQAIAQACHHVHLEYYIWKPDRIGTRLRDRLAERAAAGVEVRVLVDGIGSAQANARFWKPLRAAGGRVEHFNPISLRRLRPSLANFRTHRKIVTIDGRVGFTGGVNVADIQTAQFSGERAWRDTHLRLEGLAVRGLQMIFCEGWYYTTGEQLDGRAYFPATRLRPVAAHTVQVVASGPDENRNAIHKLYLSAITAARDRVLLTSPYFVPDESILNALALASLRKVDVRVLVPAKNDEMLVGAASRSYYPDLIDAGVKIFEYGPPMLHAKTLAVDDLVAIVGTANVDARSFLLNFEVVVASYETLACDVLAERFALDLGNAGEVTPQTLASYSWRRRLGQNFARLLSSML